jgi:sulfur-carrier protein adenylyltransferase/sulfurtransferase
VSYLDTLAAAGEPSQLGADEIRRYGRHLVIPEVGLEGQAKLRQARVLLVGAGGLGSPLALYLAAAGVGTVGLVEFDTVDESNLQRQVLFGQADLGRPKLEAAAERLAQINPHVRLEPHAVRLTSANAERILADYDLVADGSDNFATRYLVNDACVLAGKPDVWGAVFRFEGQLSVFWAARGPCYRCLFPDPPPPGAVPSCAEAGVLGVLPGIIGALQANEVVKLILGVGQPLIGRLVVFDALALRFRELSIKKSASCPVCSESPSQQGLVDYDRLCGPEEARGEATMEGGLSGSDELPWELTVEEVARWREEARDFELLDVRQPWEHEIAHIEGARLIPLKELPEHLEGLDPARPLVIHCHTGVRSLRAAAFLREHGFPRSSSMKGGIEAWSREIDPQVPRY